jgi:nucleotide-binding universal stress UspA family protein
MKDSTIPALSRLLLPVKDFDIFCKTLPLVEFVSRRMSNHLENLELLHVIGGSFLSTHLNNIDFRAGHVLSSDLMKRLRKQHYEEFVNPLLVKVQDLLLQSGEGLNAKVRVEDGDPVKKISSICEQENFSTLILARRKKEGENIVTETALNGILLQFLEASVYIIGEDGLPESKSPASRIIVGIDGSPASLRAAREAAMFLTRADGEVEEVALVNVRDPSCFLDDSGMSCKKASDVGYSYLREAEELLIAEGVDESKIATILLFGRPGQTLTEYAQTFDATMCYVGRRDRSKLAEVLLGSVCGDIIQLCRKTTLVLVS